MGACAPTGAPVAPSHPQGGAEEHGGALDLTKEAGQASPRSGGEGASPDPAPPVPSEPGQGSEGRARALPMSSDAEGDDDDDFDLTASDPAVPTRASDYSLESSSPSHADQRSLERKGSGAASASGSTAPRSVLRVMSSCTPGAQVRALSITDSGAPHPMSVAMRSPQTRRDTTGRRPVSPRPFAGDSGPRSTTPPASAEDLFAGRRSREM